MKYTINLNGKYEEVLVSYKDIKTVRLKVFPNGEIKLSVPKDTPENWIREFLFQKKEWIEMKLNLFHNTMAIEKEENIRSGTSTRILGRQIIIQIEEAIQKRVHCEDCKMILFTTRNSNEFEIEKQFNNWWQKNAKAYYIRILNDLFPIVGKHGVKKPKIFVKKMKTLWGSCSRKHSRINLNFYLFKAPRPCIEYVILHELTHFLYPYHDRDFYDFISIHMPDWKERKKQLDYEIVLGI